MIKYQKFRNSTHYDQICNTRTFPAYLGFLNYLIEYVIQHNYRINNQQLSESYRRGLLLEVGKREDDSDILFQTALEQGQKLVGTTPQKYSLQTENCPPACYIP